CGSETIVDMFW
nr:immunoglobulin heavy chain junction region [Macaca mulatta]